MKPANIGRVLATALLLAGTLGATRTLIADRLCETLSCGSGSKRCLASGSTCLFCTGATVTQMCALRLGSSCNHTGNVSCGSTTEGSCITPGGGAVGSCVGTTPVSPSCQVLGC
jgi:hypothetical protein